jgi:DNA-directed RNA polymerase subunit H (RpoH/RPB5)
MNLLGMENVYKLFEYWGVTPDAKIPDKKDLDNEMHKKKYFSIFGRYGKDNRHSPNKRVVVIWTSKDSEMHKITDKFKRLMSAIPKKEPISVVFVGDQPLQDRIAYQSKMFSVDFRFVFRYQLATEMPKCIFGALHRPMSKEEVKKFIQQTYNDPMQLPLVRFQDTQIIWSDAQPGEVVEIKHPEHIHYRIVSGRGGKRIPMAYDLDVNKIIEETLSK